jgi:uncharacterized protein
VNNLNIQGRNLIEAVVIPPSTGKAFELNKGDLIRITAAEGKQVGDFVCFNRKLLKEKLSTSRTIVENKRNFRITTGDYLYSNSWNKMFKIVDDTCGYHDLIFAPCSTYIFEHRLGEGPHTGCYEHLYEALKPFGIDQLDIPDPFNVFMRSEIDSDQSIEINQPSVKINDYIELIAEMDSLIGLSTCAVRTGDVNAGKCKSLGVEIYR